MLSENTDASPDMAPVEAGDVEPIFLSRWLLQWHQQGHSMDVEHGFK